MKMQGQHWDKPHFEGAMQYRTARCEVISESQNLNIHKATRLLLLKVAYYSFIRVQEVYTTNAQI